MVRSRVGKGMGQKMMWLVTCKLRLITSNYCDEQSEKGGLYEWGGRYFGGPGKLCFLTV